MAKEAWLKSQCRQINNDLKRGVYSKRAYNTIKSITYTTSKTTSIIEDKDGTPPADDLSRLRRWTKYCKDLYSHPIEPDLGILDDFVKLDNEEGLSILNSEVELAIQILKSVKTPGIDNIPGELIKSGGPIMTTIFRELYQQIW